MTQFIRDKDLEGVFNDYRIEMTFEGENVLQSIQPSGETVVFPISEGVSGGGYATGGEGGDDDLGDEPPEDDEPSGDDGEVPEDEVPKLG